MDVLQAIVVVVLLRGGVVAKYTNIYNACLNSMLLLLMLIVTRALPDMLVKAGR